MNLVSLPSPARPGKKRRRAKLLLPKPKKAKAKSAEAAPLKVMERNMTFWERYGDDITRQLEEMVVDVNDAGQREETNGLMRDLLMARTNSQRCAVDLANFLHPKVAPVAYVPPPAPPGETPELPSDPIEAGRVYQLMVKGVAA